MNHPIYQIGDLLYLYSLGAQQGPGFIKAEPCEVTDVLGNDLYHVRVHRKSFVTSYIDNAFLAHAGQLHKTRFVSQRIFRRGDILAVYAPQTWDRSQPTQGGFHVVTQNTSNSESSIICVPLAHKTKDTWAIKGPSLEVYPAQCRFLGHNANFAKALENHLASLT
jgi:hypothetical protein